MTEHCLYTIDMLLNICLNYLQLYTNRFLGFMEGLKI